MANQICKVLEGIEFGEVEQIYAFVVDGAGNLFANPIVNQSSNPRAKAVIDISTMADLSDSSNLIAIAHSHPEGGADLSEQDKKFSDAWQIPVIAICAKTKKYESYFPCEFTAERFPLEGRGRIVEFLDCYSLVRDFYYLNYKVSLRRMGQRIGWAVDELGEDCLEDFDDFSEKKHGDILVFGRKGQFLHCGVYVGDDKILHQTGAKLSCVENLSSNLKETFVRGWRLKNNG